MSVQVIIYDYVDGSGENVIETWMRSIGVKSKAAINNKMEHILAQTPQDQWHLSRVAAKRKGEPDIWEIKVKADNSQWRPLGFFGPERGVFTLLVGALEKGDKLQPPNVPAVAQTRKLNVQSNPAIHRRIHVY